MKQLLYVFGGCVKKRYSYTSLSEAYSPNVKKLLCGLRRGPPPLQNFGSTYERIDASRQRTAAGRVFQLFRFLPLLLR